MRHNPTYCGVRAGTAHPSRSSRPNITAVARALGWPTSGSAPDWTSTPTTVVLALEHRARQRALAAVVEPVDVGAAGDQGPDRVGVAVVRREHQQRVAGGVGEVRRHAGVDVRREPHVVTGTGEVEDVVGDLHQLVGSGSVTPSP